jgi:hypothetical protein
MSFSSLLNNNQVSSFSRSIHTFDYFQQSFPREHSETHSSLLPHPSILFSGNIIPHAHFNELLGSTNRDVYNNNRNDVLLFD